MCDIYGHLKIQNIWSLAQSVTDSKYHLISLRSSLHNSIHIKCNETYGTISPHFHSLVAHASLAANSSNLHVFAFRVRERERERESREELGRRSSCHSIRWFQNAFVFAFRNSVKFNKFNNQLGVQKILPSLSCRQRPRNHHFPTETVVMVLIMITLYLRHYLAGNVAISIDVFGKCAKTDAHSMPGLAACSGFRCCFGATLRCYFDCYFLPP
jgi:hypothetical protein